MSRHLCANTAALNDYLAQAAKRESSADRVEARARELMLPAAYCDPLDANNLAEAISEANPPEFVKLANLLRKQDDIAAGNLMRHISAEYWLKSATRIAAQAIEDEDREKRDYPCCGGRGCSKCERNEF